MGFAKKLEGLLEKGRFCQEVVQKLAAAADASRIPAGSTKAKACCQLFLRGGEPVPLHLLTAAGRQQPLGEGGIVLLGSLPCFGTRQFWSLVLLLLLRLCNVFILCFRKQNNSARPPLQAQRFARTFDARHRASICKY